MGVCVEIDGEDPAPFPPKEAYSGCDSERMGLAELQDGSSGTLSASVPVDHWPYLAVAVQVVGTTTTYGPRTSSRRKTTQSR
jgi:hypothetical protein